MNNATVALLLFKLEAEARLNVILRIQSVLQRKHRTSPLLKGLIMHGVLKTANFVSERPSLLPCLHD
jgi:hypothetical protein